MMTSSDIVNEETPDAGRRWLARECHVNVVT